MAGFTDSIAGGGGLLTVPVLLAAGLPPQLALGTNKLQSSFGSVTASWVYLRNGVIHMKGLWLAVGLTIVGASGGTLLVQAMDGNRLRALIPWLLLAVFLFFLLKPRLGLVKRPGRITLPLVLMLFSPLLGFYDRYLGPGTGSFWAFALVLLGGLELPQSHGHHQNFECHQQPGLPVLVPFGGQRVVHGRPGHGAWPTAGSPAGRRTGGSPGRGLLVRPVFLCVVFLTLLKLWTQA